MEVEIFRVDHTGSSATFGEIAPDGHLLRQGGFTLNLIKGYREQYPKEMGLVSGRKVDITLSPEGLVESVRFHFEDMRPKLFGRGVLPWAAKS